MESQYIDRLAQTFQTAGPAATIQRLCDTLREQNDLGGLFYALLLRKRFALGLSPIPTSVNQDLPTEKLDAYEDGIRDAARTVGQLYLDQGSIPQAWTYYRILGEHEPVKKALENLVLADDQDTQPLIDIALYQGVLPEKGFTWILERHGICNAITTLSSGELPLTPEARKLCIRKLVRALHAELLERLSREIAQKQEGFESKGKSVHDLIAGRDWLFAEDYYHLDLSHLNAVTQMAIQLDDGDELKLARELCAYGKRLSTRFRYPSDPPFEDQYADYDRYLAVLTGEEVDAGLAHFREKADRADPHEIGTYPAEVFVNLLLRLNRVEDALAVARQHLARLGDARLSCPTLVELCERTGRFDILAELSREQGNAVNFVAGLIAGKGQMP